MNVHSELTNFPTGIKILIDSYLKSSNNATIFSYMIHKISGKESNQCKWGNYPYAYAYAMFKTLNILHTHIHFNDIISILGINIKLNGEKTTEHAIQSIYDILLTDILKRNE